MTKLKEEISTEVLADAWKVVEKSRHPQRPYALDYVNNIFTNFEELKGDRSYREDLAIIGGIAEFTHPSTGETEGVFIVANQKGRKTKEKVERNFGMARPEGYRKAMRIFDLAERFNKPLISFIDTPGAFPGIGAEERGQAVAIAESIRKMFEIKCPTIGVVIGEGGSGGALALGVTDRLLMLENSIYSVISPESCAAILWGNSGEMRKAAHALKLSAQDTYRLGLCDKIVPEFEGGAHLDHDKTAVLLKEAISSEILSLKKIKTPEELLENRFQKFRNIDVKNIRTSNTSHS